jgi:hypothetical protein
MQRPKGGNLSFSEVCRRSVSIRSRLRWRLVYRSVGSSSVEVAIHPYATAPAM